MQRGVIWGICIFNTVVVGVVVLIVARPYLHPELPPIAVLPTLVDATPLLDWKSALEHANTYSQLEQAIDRIPDDEDAKSWLAIRIQDALHHKQIHADSFVLDMLLAEIRRWERFVSYGDDDSTRLERIVTDPSMPILVRATALKAVADSAFRKRKMELSAGNASTGVSWHQTWLDFLSQLVATTTGTSLQGQALLLLDAGQQHDVFNWPTENWDEALGSILALTSTADESSIVVALNLSPTRATHQTIHDSVRQLAEKSRSEILKTTAINTLAQVGSPADIQWLTSYPAESVKISQAIWLARSKIKVAEPSE